MMDLKDLSSLLVCVLWRVLAAEEWSYDGKTGAGPDQWKNFYPMCAGYSQSPVDIPITPEYDASLNDFQFHGYDSFEIGDLEITNDGRRVNVDIKKESIGKAYFTGGGYDGKYVALQLHFHWGLTDNSGSLHTFNGNHYAAELHIPHFKEEYENAEVALNHTDGATVLSFPFQISESDNTDLEPFFDSFKEIRYKGQKTPFNHSLDIFFGKDTSEFYKYHGSLAHPSCAEVITWALFKRPNVISSSQLEQFRQLSETEEGASEQRNITKNIRPIQPLGSRKVKANFQSGSISTAVSFSYMGLLLCLTFSVLMNSPACTGTRV